MKENDIQADSFFCEYTGKTEGVNKWLKPKNKGHYKNSEYEAFQDAVQYTIIQKRNQVNFKQIDSECVVYLIFRISKNHDIDSLIKPVLDCLQHGNIIKNDNLIMRLNVEKEIKASKELDRIRIAVYSKQHACLGDVIEGIK